MTQDCSVVPYTFNLLQRPPEEDGVVHKTSFILGYLSDEIFLTTEIEIKADTSIKLQCKKRMCWIGGKLHSEEDNFSI